jgi:hypothetical protein
MQLRCHLLSKKFENDSFCESDEKICYKSDLIMQRKTNSKLQNETKRFILLHQVITLNSKLRFSCGQKRQNKNNNFSLMNLR